MINAFILITSILLSGLINWILIKYSINLGVRNLSRTEEIRWQKRKPSVGGLSFYLVFLVFYAIISNLVFFKFIENIEYTLYSDLSIVLAASMGFIIGLIDDARNTNPLLKLIAQIGCGVLLVSFGLNIPISPNFIWNSFFTIFWTVFLMNSINMLDNMDGLTASISIVILLGFILFMGFRFDTFSSLIILVNIGALFGFLIYNWNPSRIYMGDSGSQFLGIVLAHLSILLLWQNRTLEGGYFQIKQFFLPLMIFTIPIFDTTTVTIHRLLRKQSPFVGGKDHLSHHFVFLGLKDWQSVLILVLVNLIFILIGCFFNQSDNYPIIYSLWIFTFLILQFFYIKAKKKIGVQ